MQTLEREIGDLESEQAGLTRKLQDEGPGMAGTEVAALSTHIHELEERRERLFGELERAEQEYLQASSS